MTVKDAFIVLNDINMYQGATKTVSTCPRQVVLACGQVGYQSYLSFGQVNIQKIILKNKVFLISFSGQVFASVKQITFRKSNLQVRNEMS